MENSKKKIENYSVIMSIYSKVNPQHMKSSIESILNQTYKTNDFIIIKDGPLTKEQNKILDKFYQENNEILSIYAFDKNKGAGQAYNFGIAKCRNDWAAIMDSDDIAVVNKFEKQMNYLMEHPEVDIIGSNAVEFIGDVNNIISTRIMPEFNDEIVKFAHGRCPMIQPTVIFRVKSVIDSGSYQDSPLTEDFDLYIRLIKNNYSFYTYQEILYYIRTSDDFFKRRGGIKYLKKILSFKYKHYKSGFFSYKEFLKTAISSCILSIMPNCIRTVIYKKFLRN